MQPFTLSAQFAEIAHRHLTLFVSTADGELKFVSEPLAQILGFECSDLIGTNWLDYAKPDSPTDFLPTPSPTDVKTKTFNCIILTSSGREVPLEIDTVALDGQPEHFAMICKDSSQWQVRESKLLEYIDKLRKMNEEKDQVIANTRASTARAITMEILHEASQPLTAISSYGGIALRNLEEAGEVETHKLQVFVRTMIRSSKLTADILRRFFESTCGRSAPLEEESVSQLVEDVTQLLAFPVRERRINLTTRIDPGVARLDRTQIQQVLLNLVRNSIEATQDGTGQIEIIARQKPKCWEFSVADNGKGIRKDEIERLFLPCESEKKEGAGVGLAVAQAIVRCHGGVIRYVPNHPKGARFHFELPTTPVHRNRMMSHLFSRQE